MNEILKKVFAWMGLGLVVTFLTGYYVASNAQMLVGLSNLFILFVIAEFVVVIILSARITKLNPITAKILFLLYSFLTGLTFSSIFIVYDLTSIIYVFLITAVLFGMLSFVGYVTNVDLSKFGTYLFIGLIGMIICAIVNLFIGGTVFNLIISCIGVVIFLAYTAYDVQKIKLLMNSMDEDNLAIYGALQLYLDFINLFLDLLRLFGKGKD